MRDVEWRGSMLIVLHRRLHTSRTELLRLIPVVCRGTIENSSAVTLFSGAPPPTPNPLRWGPRGLR